MKELEIELQKRYCSSIRTRGFWQTISDSSESLQKLYKRFIQKRQPLNPELPLKEQRPIDNRLELASNTRQPDQTNSSKEPLRLLLCVDEGNSRTILQQVDLNHINDDRGLFLLLRARYFACRKWFTVKSIGSLSLSQVRTSP